MLRTTKQMIRETKYYFLIVSQWVLPKHKETHPHLSSALQESATEPDFV